MFDRLDPIRSGHATLIHDDCLRAVAQLPADSIDAICTDPPYHLTSIVKRYSGTSIHADGTNERRAKAGSDAMARLSRGFMGKTWDGGDIAFRPDTWRAFYRVLKPGAHIMVFGGTRTFHRMAVAIEDAGFEIRDTLMWLYGCLDNQTEAVTSHGVMPYHKLKKGDLVLAYDPVYKSYQWEPIEEVLTYEIDDTVYRIATDHGEQIVSRNHRCIVERNGKEIFQFAEDAAREHEISVPVLEDLHALLDAISNPHAGTSGAQQNMLEKLRCKNTENDQTRGTSYGQVEGEMFCMRNNILAEHETPESNNDPCLFVQMQRQNSRQRVKETRAQGTCKLETGIESGIAGADDGRNEPGLERWRDTSESERQLCIGSIRSMPDRIPANVAKRRVCNGTSVEGGDDVRSLADQNGMRSSYRSQSVKQRSDKSHAFCDEQGSQTVRAWRGHKTVMGRITPEKYKGVIWCIRVKSGAFVAVRNGFAFPTGNSGFPKSHDVSKGIDAHLGAERRVVGSDKNFGKTRIKDGKNAYGDYAGEWNKTAPATPQAEQWSGWGTALKPAWEPIILARKPLIGSVAQNVLAHGTGALNIDASRIGTDAGRHPANVLHDGSPEVVAMFPDSKGQLARARTDGATQNNAVYGTLRHVTNNPEPRNDSGSAARFFYSAKAGKADRNGSRHPTVKPIALLEYFARMITPPGGTLLEPFGGSGTMIVAAQRIGAQIIAIEQDPWYYLDMVERLR